MGELEETYLYRIVDVNDETYYVQASDASDAADILMVQQMVTFAEDVILVERVCAFSEIIADEEDLELDILEA